MDFASPQSPVFFGSCPLFLELYYALMCYSNIVSTYYRPLDDNFNCYSVDVINVTRLEDSGLAFGDPRVTRHEISVHTAPRVSMSGTGTGVPDNTFLTIYDLAAMQSLPPHNYS